MNTTDLIYKLEPIPLRQIAFNRGQIEGLPSNPRFVRGDNFKRLQKSLDDDPEMLQLREPILYQYQDNKYVCIAGEQRIRAEKEKGTTTLLCKVLPVDTPVEKLRAYAVKDNAHAGEWNMDVLANEWDGVEIEEWMGNIAEWGTVEEEEEGSKGGNDDQEEPNFTIKLDFTEDDFRVVKMAFQTIGGTPEKIVFDLLKEKGYIKEF